MQDLKLRVCVTVREDPQPHERSLPFCACSLWPWLGPLPAGWWNPKETGQFLGFSSPLTLYSIAFGTVTKTAEPIEMQFGMTSGHGPRNTVTWGWRPRTEISNFWRNMPDNEKPNTPNNCETGPCSGTRQGADDIDCKRTLDESIIGREVGVYFRSSGWHHVFYNGPYSGYEFRYEDRICLNLLIYHTVGQNSIYYY